MVFALIGNQNCGKTTLFNQLTGSNQHVGNFPGVTVEQKIGQITSCKDCSVVDLPGIYSLSPFSAEEIVTRDFLLKQKPDCIINILDATNIERNLYLSLQLMELGIPMVLALNMMDELIGSGNFIDIPALSKELGVPIVPITASKNQGVGELIRVMTETARSKKLPKRIDFCSGPIHRAIHSIAHIVEDHAQNAGIPQRFAATKLVERDRPVTELLKLSPNELELLEHSISELESETRTQADAALVDMRYSFIEEVCAKTVTKNNHSKEHARSVEIDGILTHKYLALPIFFGLMLLIFWLTFGYLGSFLSDLFSLLIDQVTGLADMGLAAIGVNPVVHSLVIDGVFAGVGSVLSFMPTIIVLFFFLSLLEDSGYMARVAFIMDKLLRKIGLSGKSFVPMLIGFGCSVPAIMSTRTLGSERDRKMTILLTPFMSCSAKLPIYAVFSAAFFPQNPALLMMVLYVTGILVAIICGLLMKNTLFTGNPVPFVMELPPYRMPSPKSVLLLIWQRAKDFMMKAFTVIFIASLAIWALQTFDFRFNVVEDSSRSILAFIGQSVAPLFAPLGFGDWRASTALITGFTAKEAVVSTLAVLLGTSITELPASLSSLFTPLSAFSYLIFTLLYTPCVAAIAAVKRELGSGLGALGVVAFQTGVAYIVSLLVYQIGSILL